MLAASEIQGSEIIRSAINIPTATWEQLQLFSSTLDANAPLSINPLTNNISLNYTPDFELVNNQLSIKNQNANCLVFFNNNAQSGIQSNQNFNFIASTMRVPNISTSNLKTVDINCTNSTFQNLLAFDTQLQSLTAGNINVPNMTCQSLISNLGDINHITSSSLLANNISTSYLVVSRSTIANLICSDITTTNISSTNSKFTNITTNTLLSTSISATNL